MSKNNNVDMQEVVVFTEEDESLHEITERWTVKQAVLMHKRGALTFDNPRQRSYVWERFRKADLIDTILRSYPIPAFYTRKENNIYDFLDGKQRMSAICGYVNGEYALTVLHPFCYISDETGEKVVVDITGKKFDELPGELQDIIRSYTLDVKYYEGITERQVVKMFKKLNNGKPLSAKDKNIANATDLRHIIEIGENNMFHLFYNEKFIAAKKHIPIIMKVWCMMYLSLDKVSFESRIFNPIMADTVISQKQGEELSKVFDMMQDIGVQIERFASETESKKLLKKLRGELHFVSFAPFVADGIKRGFSDEDIARFFCEFYTSENKSTSEVYNEASMSCTAKNANICRRHYELMAAWNKHFGIEYGEVNDGEGNAQLVLS